MVFDKGKSVLFIISPKQICYINIVILTPEITSFFRRNNKLFYCYKDKIFRNEHAKKKVLCY